MTKQDQAQLGKTLWNIADQLRGAMSADDFRDYMLSFLFLRYLSDNYVEAVKKELGSDYPKLAEDDPRIPLRVWYENNAEDVADFEKQMRLKVHYVIGPAYLWSNIAGMAKSQDRDLLNIRKRMGPRGIGHIYGQEKNITTYNLARMNMLLHGVKDAEFEIYHGDTLDNEWDLFREENPAKKPGFDAVVANPPFSLRTTKAGDDVDDLQKIIDTYVERPEEIERYARRVGMDEIRENDYNLNITRYVSTAEPEPIIDLGETHEAIVAADKDIREMTAKHNQFLAELGLPAIPFNGDGNGSE